jgi:hypothetical protein
MVVRDGRESPRGAGPTSTSEVLEQDSRLAGNPNHSRRGAGPTGNSDFFPGYTVVLIIGIKTREKYLCRKDWKP